ISKRDWSSDVCSSDLLKALRLLCVQMGPRVQSMQKVSASLMRSARNIVNNVIPAYSANFSMYIESLRQKKAADTQNNVLNEFNRSEERRVGKEYNYKR